MAGSFLDELFAAFRGGWEVSRSEASKLLPKSTVGSGFRNPFLTEREREKRATKKLFDEVKALFDTSAFADEASAGRFYFDIVTEACERAEITPSMALGEALYSATRKLVFAEGTMFQFPEVDWSSEMTLEEGVWLRGYLERKRTYP